MTPNPTTPVLTPVKSIALLGETANEVALNVMLGGRHSVRDRDGMLLWWAMFRENLPEVDTPGRSDDRHELLGDIPSTPNLPEDPAILHLDGLYADWSFGGGRETGFTEAQATQVRAIYWPARQENEQIMDGGPTAAQPPAGGDVVGARPVG